MKTKPYILNRRRTQVRRHAGDKPGSLNLEQMEDRAICLLDSGKIRNAKRVLNQMLAIDSNCLAAHFHLARVCRRTGQYEIALRHAHRTLRLSRDEPNARLNLGIIYDVMKREKLAALHYKMELKRDPNSAETLWNIGRLYFEKRRWLNASRYLRRCFDIGYRYEIEDTLKKLGNCYYELRDIRSYIDVYTRYVQMTPDAAWAFANLGCALLRVKDYKGAFLRLSTAKRLGVKESVASELALAKKMARIKANEALA